MSFFKKIKQSLGMGTIDFDIEVPPAVANSSGRIDGTIVITAKTAQSIKDVEVKLEREQVWEQIEQRYNASTKIYEDQWVNKSRFDTIAQWKDEAPFSLAEGEVRRIPFTLIFPVVEHPYGVADNPSLWDFLSAALNFGNGYRNQRISYRIEGDADVEGAAFDKGESTPITLT